MSRLCVLILVCILFEAHGYGKSNVCQECKEFAWFPRSQNNYGASRKFYKPPPSVYPIKGPFSYTPPPGYGMDTGPPPSSKTYKVSTRPSALSDEDLYNLVKYLSKRDLDRICEMAKKKETFSSYSDSDKHNFDPDRLNYEYNGRRPMSKDDGGVTNSKFAGPLENQDTESRPKESEFNIPNSNYFNDGELFQGLQNPDKYIQSSLEISDTVPLDEFNGAIISDNVGPIRNVDINKMQGSWSEPIHDHEVAFTNESPKIVNSDSSSYKLENFANLPLMDYADSKLDTVNSYNVPHYTVTSHKQNQQPSSPQRPSVQAQSSAGKDQSDAHLKAVKIWTHKSKGSAYTLHDDGTLSPERPMKPKF